MTVAALRWFKAALVLQAILVGYWLAMEAVSIFPWNDLASLPAGYDLRWEVTLNALPLLAFMLLFALGVPPIAMLSVLGYAAYLAWQLWIWWKPFALGADAAWQAKYAASFSHTLKAIPSFGMHLAPDAQHLTLQALTLVTLIATAIAAAHMRHL